MAEIPTYDELMSKKQEFVAECDGYLYVKLPAQQTNDNTVWRVDRKTHVVSYMMFTDFLCNIMAKATYVVKPAWLDNSKLKEETFN